MGYDVPVTLLRSAGLPRPNLAFYVDGVLVHSQAAPVDDEVRRSDGMVATGKRPGL